MKFHLCYQTGLFKGKNDLWQVSVTGLGELGTPGMNEDSYNQLFSLWRTYKVVIRDSGFCEEYSWTCIVILEPRKNIPREVDQLPVNCHRGTPGIAFLAHCFLAYVISSCLVIQHMGLQASFEGVQMWAKFVLYNVPCFGSWWELDLRSCVEAWELFYLRV